MGYYVRLLPKKKTTPFWKLQFVSAKRRHAINKLTQNPRRTWDIPQERWAHLGFHKFMSLAEASSRSSQLNKQLSLKHREERRLLINEKEKILQENYAAFIPTFYREEFEHKYFFGSEVRKSKALAAWKAAQKIILDISLEPSDWFDNSRLIYRSLLKSKHSLSYCHKILRVMNNWGFFFSRKIGKPFFAIPGPRGYDRAQLLEAYFEKRGKSHRESNPLPPSELEKARNKMNSAQFNWLYLSVWLGLRPLEVDQLMNPDLIRIHNSVNGVPTLWIYQTKLVAVPPRYRWKLIPLFLEEQKLCLDIIEKKNFARPLTKTVKHHFGDFMNLYAGRKGFTDLMLSRKQNFVNISQWMGHSNIQRTWRNYKSRCLTHYDNFGEKLNSHFSFDPQKS